MGSGHGHSRGAVNAQGQRGKMIMALPHVLGVHLPDRTHRPPRWVNRTGTSYPSHLARPELTVASLTELTLALPAH